VFGCKRQVRFLKLRGWVLLKSSNLIRVSILVALAVFLPAITPAQQTLGSVNGTVTDTSGAVVQKASVKIRNTGTNLVVTVESKEDGSFSAAYLPIGSYEVTFSKDGFKTAVFSAILVQGNRTTTVDASLVPGSVSSSVTVESTPLLNQTDASNGYTMGRDVIQSVPLGTGSFTQLAILAPGTSADFLSGSGSNEGLGNQGIVANGQRDTSNTFTFNSVNANNLFNGNSTSNIADSRFTLNTGEIFGTGGQVQTNTSVFDAIGQGLPTPPVETIQELQVTTSMYDASQGSTAGAHIELTTISGTNAYHGQLYEYFQNSVFDAAPTFLVPNEFFSGAPPLHRNVFGGTIGGPILKDKLFFFGSYQGQRISDALNGAFSGVPTLAGLTDSNRSAAGLTALVNADNSCGQFKDPKCITLSEVDPTALALFNAKGSNGQFIIPSEAGTIGGESNIQKYNSAITGPPSTFKANQVNGNIDYTFNSNDRLAGKYYFQDNPTTTPFAVSGTSGFPQTVQAGSQVFSLENTAVVSPNSTWTQRFGFIRQIVNATTAQQATPSSIGLTLPAGSLFPGFSIEQADAGANDPTATGNPGTGSTAFAPPGVVPPIDGSDGHVLRIGPSSNFANAGIFQNQWEGASKYNWVLGRHTLAFGGSYDYDQLNVKNKENEETLFTFRNFADFLTGRLGTDDSTGTLLNGETNRHFRSRSASLFAQDGFKVKSNLTVTAGLRWDWDGPLYETNGLLTNFNPADYNYDLATDTFSPLPNGNPGFGLEVAGNNKTFGTKGVSNSTLTGRQWMFEPRLGVAWSPFKNFVVRAGVGLYADRGEYFTELSESAGLGISGPFSVTTQEPFTVVDNTVCPAIAGQPKDVQCLGNQPFGANPAGPPTSLAGLGTLFPDMRLLAGCGGGNSVAPMGVEQTDAPWCTQSNFENPRGFLFGGYDPRNKLPYSENWSLDVQWQPRNDLVLTLGYVGNHGVHELLPIPFNQPGIATPTNHVNNQIYSFGYLAATQTAPGGCDDFNDAGPNCIQLPAETTQTTVGNFSASDGNVALRTPFIGLNPNADLWTAEGISNYHALQVSVTKRMSHGLQINASYTYSHSLDEGSGLGAGIFYNGNNPLVPRSGYADSDFDRTHVFIISYVYAFPTIKDATGVVNALANGWGITGVTVAQSGEPFSIIDFSGAAGSIFYSGGDDEITNPILPLAPGVSVAQATSQAGGGGHVRNGEPFVNPDDFAIPVLLPGAVGSAVGQDGVPPCEQDAGTGGVLVCDKVETGFGTNGRNLFRAPFQTLFNFSIYKNFKINERFNLKFQADAFNLFNHPSYDTPNSDFELNSCFNPAPCYNTAPNPPNSKGFGVIDGTIGASRFFQFSLHLTF
jgi:Carboxypeptidase regulatory-like domain